MFRDSVREDDIEGSVQLGRKRLVEIEEERFDALLGDVSGMPVSPRMLLTT